MATIRLATRDDEPALVELGEIMHSESIHAELRFDRQKMAAMVRALIDSPDGLAIVAQREGRVIGGFLGVAEEHFFSRDKFSSDLAVFIDPQHRGGFVAARLLKHYVEWAKSRGVFCINSGVASGINHDVSIRLYERIGFVQTGVAMEYLGD